MGLRCIACGSAYRVIQDVPRLIVDETPQEVPHGILHRLAARPRVYDLVQYLSRKNRVLRLIQPALESTAFRTVLDVGAGTGSIASFLPTSARYIWLDRDPNKLAGYGGKSDGDAVLGDGTRLGIRSKAVDDVVCSCISHHLDDEQLESLCAELSRVARNRLFFLDAVRSPSPVARLLWKYDRGAHPRSDAALLTVLGRYFDIGTITRFRVFHSYLFVVAAARTGSPAGELEPRVSHLG